MRLNATAIEALRGLPPRIDTPQLFPFKPNQVTQAFVRAVRRAGISDFRLHDCRHTFASYQAMSGTVVQLGVATEASLSKESESRSSS